MSKVVRTSSFLFQRASELRSAQRVYTRLSYLSLTNRAHKKKAKAKNIRLAEKSDTCILHLPKTAFGKYLVNRQRTNRHEHMAANEERLNCRSFSDLPFLPSLSCAVCFCFWPIQARLVNICIFRFSWIRTDFNLLFAFSVLLSPNQYFMHILLARLPFPAKLVCKAYLFLLLYTFLLTSYRI